MFKRTLLIIALVAALGVTPAVGWLFFGDTIKERMSRQRFEPAAWQSQKDFDGVRIRMVDDLLRRHSFQGMSREQLISIVGEPDKTEYFKEWDLVYWLGPERGFMGIDSEWLVFRLDDKERISEFGIVRD